MAGFTGAGPTFQTNQKKEILIVAATCMLCAQCGASIDCALRVEQTAANFRNVLWKSLLAWFGRL